MPQTKKQGTLHVDPATGERRIRLADIKKLKAEEEGEVIRLSLDQLLLGTFAVEGNDNTEIRLKPLNLKGMAQLENLYGSLSDVKTDTVDDVMKIATVLANQDRPDTVHAITKDEVGRLLNEDTLPIVRVLVERLVNPTSAESVSTPQRKKSATRKKNRGGSTGHGSSLRSQSGSATSRKR